MKIRCFAPVALMLLLGSTRLSAQIPSNQIDSLLTDEEQAALVNSGILGTSQVIFNEGRVAGELISCSLVFTATFQDFAYREGQLQTANGNFTIFGGGELPVISMKLGVAALTKDLADYEHPEFAYFESSFGSSAKMKQTIEVIDPGYKLFVYSSGDPVFPDMYGSLLSSKKFKISFNRNVGGLDQSFDLETDVSDISVDPRTSQFIRMRSDSAMNEFNVCSLSLLSSMIEKDTP